MKIFIDFDDVLFNTRKFKNDLLDIFIRNGVTKKQFLEESYWGKKYNLEKQIESIGKKYNIDTEKIKNEIVLFLKDLTQYVFLDFYDFIKNFDKENIFLISYGHKNIQMQKIKNSGLGDSFSKVIITGEHKSKSILDTMEKEKIGDDIYFIDDRVQYIDEVKKIFRK